MKFLSIVIGLLGFGGLLLFSFSPFVNSKLDVPDKLNKLDGRPHNGRF